MGNVMGPPPLSSLLTDIHTAGASESPSFPQTAHLAIPRKKETVQAQNTQTKTVSKTQNIQNMFTFTQICTTALPPRGWKFVWGFWVALSLPPENTWRQCAGTAHQTQHCGCLHRKYTCRLPSVSSRMLWHKGSKEGREEKRTEQKSTAW